MWLTQFLSITGVRVRRHEVEVLARQSVQSGCHGAQHPATGGIKTHMGYNREAYGAGCAALARALETASRRLTTPERVTIFTDTQSAIRQMASEEPGPG